eukprot:443848-Rhodomonas_salina.1
MRLYCREKRIKQEFSNAGEHWQNPRAEAAIGTLSIRARALMAHAGVPHGYWEEALEYACQIENRCTPTS